MASPSFRGRPRGEAVGSRSLGRASIKPPGLDLRQLEDFHEGDLVDGTVRAFNDLGALVKIGVVVEAILPQGEMGNTKLLVGDDLMDLAITGVDTERRHLLVSRLGKRPEEHRVGSGVTQPFGSGERRSCPDKGLGKNAHGKSSGKSKSTPLASFETSDIVTSSGKGKGKAGWFSNGDRMAKGQASDRGKGQAQLRPAAPRRAYDDVKLGEVVQGNVTRLTEFGVFIDFGCEMAGVVPMCLIGHPPRVGELLMSLHVTGVDENIEHIMLEPIHGPVDDDDDDDDDEESDELPEFGQWEDSDIESLAPAMVNVCSTRLPAGRADLHGAQYAELSDSADEVDQQEEDHAKNRDLLQDIELGDVVEGTVTSVTNSGALIDLGLPVEGFLPQRLFDWPVQPGDHLTELVITEIDYRNRECTLGLAQADMRVEKKIGVGGPRRGAGSALGGAGPGRGRAGGSIGCNGRGRGGANEPDEDLALGNDATPSESSDVKVIVAETRSNSRGELAPLLQKIASGQRSAARELAETVAAASRPLHSCAIASAALKVLMRRSKCAAAALLGLQELSEKLGRIAEPMMVHVIPSILEKYADGQRSIQVAAEDAAETIVARLNPYGIDTVLPALLNVLRQREKTAVKVGALHLLALLRGEDSVRPLARKLDLIIPFVAEMLLDVKRDVQDAALHAGQVLFECCGNSDLNAYTGGILSALKDRDEIPSCVNQLSEIVFVQAVETQALAIVMPLILRGLKERDEHVKRRALVIADNMCKLVPDVTEVHPFLPHLIPLVRKAKDAISNPEVRSVAERCYATLDDASKADCKKQVEKAAVAKLIREKVPDEKHETILEMMIDYVAQLCCSLSACRIFDNSEWWQCVAPYLTPHFLTAKDCEELVPMLIESCYDAAEGDDVEDNDEDGEDLCNCVFTLGYGAHTLLNNTRLHLKRGKCYGLCGANDCGKSTLLRAINNAQVENFPPKTEVVTAFVEHGIGEKMPECDWTPLEFMFSDETIQAMEIPKRKVRAALKSLGFSELMQKQGIGQLSGGWKMKLGLVRAMLMCADILLLDEPTGHLDVTNVAWLAEYVAGLTRDKTRPVTTIVISHDAPFLDKVCTHIINFKRRKLKTYVGSITDFVRRCPEAKSYVTLVGGHKKFTLPEPGMLEGVKSKGKMLLKMKNVTFAYPGSDMATLFNVSIEVSMLSRVAVIGPNGAGKSTMIRALVGELSCVDGTVWKHPNARISYVAQHTFHHLEAHTDKTATQYFLWRFRGGEDIEALDNKAEEERKMKKRKYLLKDGQLVCLNEDDEGEKAVEPEAILNRRKSKQRGGGRATEERHDKYDYQVKWRFTSMEQAMWVDRDKLVDMGALRLVQREDERHAAANGLVSQPLTQPNIEEHLLGFGLEASFSSHQRAGTLSGGQKVKIVMGAATWLSPHILILDEPTNYLDRDSLGALGGGLRDFGGGVIIISHNREFADWICDERWVMEKGNLRREGHLDKEDVLLSKELRNNSYTDEFGNHSTVAAQKKAMTEKELKRHMRQKELRKKNGEEVSEGEDEDAWYEKLLDEAQKT